MTGESDYFKLLKEKFPKKSDVLTEIINLDAIQHLPKGTEHFVSDLHGEFEAFDYIVRTGSGAIKRKVMEILSVDSYSSTAVDELCQLIYYPKEKMEQLKHEIGQRDTEKQLQRWIGDLLLIADYIGEKYTRSKIRKLIPKSFVYIIEELLTESHKSSKHTYQSAIINKIQSLGQLVNLTETLCYFIQSLVMDHLHVIGDIYDRGLFPDRILDKLCQLGSVDIQWGNHDIIWMGAVSGSFVCMMTVIRIASRYDNLTLIEDSYGINLRPLIDYSRTYYHPVAAFNPVSDGHREHKEDDELVNSVQQAAFILQLKLEHQLISRRPEFLMQHRQLLDKIDYDLKTIRLDNKIYNLHGFAGDCIDKACVDSLSAEEEDLLCQLMKSFQSSEKLKRHMEFLFSKGSMYLVYNNQLLFHGCIPLHPNGDFKSITIAGQSYAGKALLDFYQEKIRESYYHEDQHYDLATDLFWYLWAGENSTLFGKKAMTTFERYYILDKETHKEEKNSYYSLRDSPEMCISLLKEFGLSKTSHIITGHTPVIELKGENPIKASGRMLVIDGGFAKGYQQKTGIAGYTLIFNSYGLELVAHRPFTNIDDVLNGQGEIIFTKRLVERVKRRQLVGDTNIGEKIADDISHLEQLYYYFEEY